MVTVIIPTFNRASLLLQTIPTYLQQDVCEIILIDDCSSDNTAEISKILMEKYKSIRYIRLEKNSKQVVAKNIGIKAASSEWIYFGDDDSVLSSGSISNLLKTASKYNANVVGAKALYMNDGDCENVEEFVEANNQYGLTIKEIVDLKSFKTNFSLNFPMPVEVPFTHACALIETDLAKNIMFDENFTGNCYREETDFFLRCKFAGAKIMYDSSAVQTNLPRKIATGGAHSSGKIKWYFYTIKNNYYFLKKNVKLINKNFNLNLNIYVLNILFIKNLFAGLYKNIYKRLLKWR